MDVAELVLDYFDVLKWPVVAAFVLLLLFLYRQQVGGFVAGLIERTQSAEVGPTGARFTFAAEQKVSAPSEPLSPKGPDLSETAPALIEELRKSYEQTAKVTQEADILREQYVSTGDGVRHRPPVLVL